MKLIFQYYFNTNLRVPKEIKKNSYLSNLLNLGATLANKRATLASRYYKPYRYRWLRQGAVLMGGLDVL